MESTKTVMMPKDCKILRHTTSFNGIIDIIKSGGTLDTESLIKKIYNERSKLPNGKCHINTVDGYSVNGPRNIRSVYDSGNEAYNECFKIKKMSPKGHYVSLEKNNWKKFFTTTYNKKVNIYYKWSIMKDKSYKIRKLWSENDPTEKDFKHNLNEPGPNGEYVFQKGVDIVDWLCVTAPSDYKDEPMYKEWSLELEKLCLENDIVLYWVNSNNERKDLTIHKVYKEHG